MLSWRIIGVAAGHSNAMSNPASITMGRSSRRRSFHHRRRPDAGQEGRADVPAWDPHLDPATDYATPNGDVFRDEVRKRAVYPLNDDAWA